MTLSDYEGAKQAYRRAVDLGVEKASAFYDLGVISEQQDQLEAARSYFHQALLKDASHADSYHRLGAVTAKLDKQAQAATYYLEAIKRDPGHAGAHYSLAQLYLKQGRGAEGQELMQVFARLKEYEGRLASRKRAVDRVPRDPPAGR